MTTAKRREAMVTKEALLGVAERMYERDGYEKTNLRRIAKELNISGPAVYYHFSSKSELLSTAYINRMGRSLAAHENISAEMDPIERLWTFTVLHVYLQFPEDYDGPYSFGSLQLVQHCSKEDQVRLKKTLREYFERLTDIIDAGIKDGSFMKLDRTSTAFAIFGMSNNCSFWYKADGKLTLKKLAKTYGDFALRMVGAEPIKEEARLLRLVDQAQKNQSLG